MKKVKYVYEIPTEEYLNKLSNACFYEHEDYEIIKKVFEALAKM